MDSIDFATIEEKARGMTSEQLHYARLDILRTLPHADAMDRLDGGNRGGRYRDESSVYAAEQRRRADSRRATSDARLPTPDA